MKKYQLGLGIITLGFVGLATYSNLEIQSNNFMYDNEIKFVKRIDELQGKTVRSVASIKPISFFPTKEQSVVSRSLRKIDVIPVAEAAVNTGAILEKKEQEVASAIMQDLDLSLVEVYSPKKFANMLTKNQFEGNLVAAQGTIDLLEVKLPGTEIFSISQIKIKGNLFNYDYNGEKFKGMIFTTDNKSFMVSLDDGPLAGTRLKFEGQPEVAEVQDNNVQEEPVVAEVAPVQPVRVDINNQDPSFQNIQAQNLINQPADGAEFSQEEINSQVQTQGFNFGVPTEQAQM